jgi:hypothetical protein
MVAISRVFDVEGLWEVLGEVGRDFAADKGTSEDKDEEGMEIIIIDNMTQLINELFARKEKGEGTLLFPFGSLYSSEPLEPGLILNSTYSSRYPLTNPPHPDTHEQHPRHPP